MKAVTIKLAEPLAGHGGMIHEITLKPPLARDYMELGDPNTVTRLPDGGYYVVENNLVVREYIGRCADQDLLLIENASLRDAIEIRNAVLGFFAEARAKTSD